MRTRPGRIESLLTIGVLLTLLGVVVAGTFSFRRYSKLSALAEAGARYAAVHGRVSDETYMRPYGTTAALRAYLAEKHAGEDVDVFVEPAEPNLLPPGSRVTVTVSGPWVPNPRIANLVNFTLKSSSSATIIQ